MTDILPPAVWLNVRQLETNEYATGGFNGNMNEQAKSLAARSELLKQYAALPYESKTGGYALNERVQLATGDIVRSTIVGNVNNPNENMTGWVKTNDASQIISADGSTQQEINDFGGAKWWNKPLGYDISSTVKLENGDIVKSTVANNTKNPNVDITGWVNVNDATQLKYKLKPNLFGSTIAAKLSESVSTADFGSIGDGTLHTLQEWIDSGKFSNLTAIQMIYPHATALTDSIDWVACQGAIDYVGKGGSILFNQTTVNSYIIDRPLKFYNGQKWIGTGGIDVIGLGTEIKLSANATSVAEPKTPTETTYGFNPVGIYFNAQNFGDAGLSLYNTSYANVDQCAANSTKAGGCGILLDSDVSKQCYFNKINLPRVFAGGTGGAGIRFTRGANANQVFGGKCGSSYRGMEFLDLSSGNLILATDFEENTNCHVYVDAANNVFSATHMEVSPVGFDITVKGTNTQRMNTTFATNTVIAVRDESKIGTVLDTRVETLGITGDLRFGPARFKSVYLTGTSRLEYDPDLVSATSSAVIQFFRNIITTGARQLIFYKGDGSGTYTFLLNAATGDVTCEDIAQGPGQAGAGVSKRLMRRAAVPAAGAFSTGETIKRTSASSAGPVTEWTCTTSGTPGLWQASAWVVGKGGTASRPSLASTDAGVQYFDTTLAAAGKPIWWTGSAWVDALGAVV